MICLPGLGELNGMPVSFDLDCKYLCRCVPALMPGSSGSFVMMLCPMLSCPYIDYTETKKPILEILPFSYGWLISMGEMEKMNTMSKGSSPHCPKLIIMWEVTKSKRGMLQPFLILPLASKIFSFFLRYKIIKSCSSSKFGIQNHFIPGEVLYKLFLKFINVELGFPRLLHYVCSAETQTCIIVGFCSLFSFLHLCPATTGPCNWRGSCAHILESLVCS